MSVERWATVAEADQCWPYKGRCFVKSKGGRMTYGRVELNKKRMRVHRAVWTVVHGAIPDGLFVLHACDNPLCCNPTHLFLGTQADNMADKMRKGRHRVASGERHYLSKITAEIAQQIRDMDAPLRTIGAKYGINSATVHAIKSGKTWRQHAS